MRKQTLRVLSKVMCLILLASVVLQAPLMAVETIGVKVGGQTFRVTPGQWVSVRQGTQTMHYNVRFVNGRPVALEMSQYTKLVFGEGVAAGSIADDVANAGSVADDVANAGSVADDVANAGSVADDIANAGSVADDVAAAGQNPVGDFGSVADDVAAGGSIADDIAQSGSIADDVAQAGTAGQSSQSSSQSSQAGQAGQVADDIANAGSVADDIANAGSVADDVAAGSIADDVANAGSVADDVANAGSIADDVANAGSVADDVAQAGTTTKRAWDPSRHPRDPQTGRFISHKEAIERGLMDPSQAGGSVADDVAQAGSAADDVAQSGAKGKPGFKDKVSGKFQAGYHAGKGMVNQGFNNVKTSLKSGFSAKNLLVTAGITVGVDLATQIMRGEKPSAKKALKTVCSAEFVGGVGGAVVGAAAGSFFVPFLSAIPVVGGALSALAPAFGSIVGSSVGAYTAGDLKNGRFSIKEAFKRIDWVGVTGQAIGSTVGAALGSCLGPIGTVVGGIAGGYLGNWAAQKISKLFGKGKAAQLPEMAMPSGSGNPMGDLDFGDMTGEVTIGDGVAGPVSGDEEVLVLGDSAEVLGDYESEVALAYSKYQELYKLYNEMLRQGKQEDALAVAEAMNKAKAEYDQLRNQK